MKNVDDILAERGHTYGDFGDIAKMVDEMKVAIGLYGDKRMSPVQKLAIDNIIHKIARAVVGNPDHVDNWDDIAGYAQLAAKDVRSRQSLPTGF